jgi:hypothetical protein
MLLEDNAKSRSAVSLKEPHFPVDRVFIGASYARRYELLCRRMVRERHYSAACLILAAKDQGATGGYSQPADDLTMAALATSMVAHARGALGLV